MQTLYIIYFELLLNLSNALLLFHITENKLNKQVSNHVKFCYYLIQFFVSFFLKTSLITIVLFASLFPLIYIIYTFQKNYRTALKCFIQYEIIFFIIYTLAATVYTIIFNDSDITIISRQYNSYKTTIISLLTYIIYTLCSSKMNIIKNKYLFAFNSLIIGISIILSYITLSISLSNPDSYQLPAIFATIFVLLIVCISLYNKFLSVIEENTNYRIKLELDKMEKEYSAQIDNKLKQLHSLRHDMKNHLIIINGYAIKGESNKISTYIDRISNDLSLTKTVDSGSHIVSALISEKEKLAKSQNINCDIITNTPSINIDDFSITTIIGNLFDNAITAASKCEQGWINFELAQTGSYLNIVIENSHCENLIENNCNFSTTKTDNLSPHGIGIKNVRKVIAKLNGQINFSYSNECFLVEAQVPNYN